MNYNIIPGSIACIVRVNDVTIVYFSEKDAPGRMEPGDLTWQALPAAVQSAITTHFQQVYEKLDGMRGTFNYVNEFEAWFKDLKAIEVEVPDDDVPALAMQKTIPASLRPKELELA